MKELFSKKLMPAVTLKDADSARKLAEAYLEAGLDIMEVTFRTEATLAAIEAVARDIPEMNIGAGTILNPEQVQLAKDAGASFGLSPGFNGQVVQTARENDFPFIPGILTPSEIEKALAAGCEILKLFPADAIGGTGYIQSLEGPYLQTGVQFIPMGGVNQENLSRYLKCQSVIAVGGSWLAPKIKIRNGDFSGITEVVSKSIHLATLG